MGKKKPPPKGLAAVLSYLSWWSRLCKTSSKVSRICSVRAQTLTDTSVAERIQGKKKQHFRAFQQNTIRGGVELLWGPLLGNVGVWSERWGSGWHEAQRRPVAPKGQSRVESVSPRRTQLELPLNSSTALKKPRRLEPPHDSLAKVLWGWGGLRGRGEEDRSERARRGTERKFSFFLALKLKSFSHSHFGV